jgi:hypothetical protein
MEARLPEFEGLNISFPDDIDDRPENIWKIMKLVPYLFVKIAPARSEEVKQYLKEITFEILDEKVWRASYCFKTKKIILSIRALEILWCASYAYYTIYKEIFEGKDAMKPVSRNIFETPKARTAFELYTWALTDWMNDSKSDWPEGFPKPEEPRPITKENLTGELMASEFCLTAIGYILHHELAHHYLKHDSRKLEFEKAADIEAFNWILNDVKATDLEIRKRSLGISIALSLLNTREIAGIQRALEEMEDLAEKNHPPVFERMSWALENLEGYDHVVWAFSFVAFCMVIYFNKIPMPAGSFDNFKEGLNAVFDMLPGYYKKMYPDRFESKKGNLNR